MEVENGEYIDAAKTNSLMRYVNHSCGPNCRMYLWEKDGTNVAVLEAIRDIRSGEELTFRYRSQGNFKPTGTLIVCKCKAENCHSYI